ncbi:replication protein A 70 kDa DNA-binding subunit B [Tanacetum coccineum]
MQGAVRMALVNQFKDRLKEGSAVVLEGYSLGEIQPKFRMVKKALRLSFLSNTKVEPCPDFNGSFYGFDFRGGNELQCTLWSEFAQQFNDFLNTCVDHGKIIVVLQLAMMKIWDGKMCVQNGYNATKLFLFDATQPIVEEEFQDFKEYSNRLFAREDVEKSENMATRISTNSKNSTKETFVGKNPPRNIAELLNVAQGVTSVIVGTIITIHEEEGWWYIGCRSCKKKVIREKEIIDLETDMPKKVRLVKMIGGAQSAMLFQPSKPFRVQDETCTMSLTLWNDEVQAVVDKSVYQLCEKYAMMDTEATSYVLHNITPLDLDLQTDENTTLVSTQKNNVVDHVEQQHDSDGKNKHAAENDIGNESLNEKKRLLK